jgi:hypothetical protein
MNIRGTWRDGLVFGRVVESARADPTYQPTVHHGGGVIT